MPLDELGGEIDFDTVLEEILSGALDSLPEQAFYLKGGIADVKKAAEQLSKAG